MRLHEGQHSDFPVKGSGTRYATVLFCPNLHGITLGVYL